MTGSVLTLIAIPWFVLQTTGSAARLALLPSLRLSQLSLLLSSAAPLLTDWGIDAPASWAI
jgi:hypothetical protein